MSKRKFKRGQKVTDISEFMKHDFFIINGKTFHCGWVRSWQLQMAQAYIDRGSAFVAVRLTNGEFYDGMTDEQIKDMLEDHLCDFCSLPEGARGCHCYGDQPVMCEGSHCDEAIEGWKEEYVE